jgi:D-proline reductase (dithiol) PrdB
MNWRVDSYRFLDFGTQQLVKSWIKREPEREIPWVPLEKPASQGRVSLVSSAAVALRTDEPFDQEGERKNPWWGDPSYRVIPRGATEKDVEIYHLHIDPSFGREDLNCVLPLGRLEELQEMGEIGEVAPRHYSYMGYTIDPTELLQDTVPKMVRNLREDRVDLVLLVPT